MISLPHNSTNPRIVIGYDNQLKIMVDQTNDELWTKEDFEQLEKYKIQYLEKKLGYEIKFLHETIIHDDYEKNLEQSTTFYKKDK